ncbi:hypothetical protein ACFWWC_46170 [Streptomyces sp. NPDC058642]|uniref:hypothetical protein n=1 Tax=Streptomyces sp. NPDC058642 TaxID=3346572 RepID=UPI00366586BB
MADLFGAHLFNGAEQLYPRFGVPLGHGEQPIAVDREAQKLRGLGGTPHIHRHYLDSLEQHCLRGTRVSMLLSTHKRHRILNSIIRARLEYDSLQEDLSILGAATRISPHFRVIRRRHFLIRSHDTPWWIFRGFILYVAAVYAGRNIALNRGAIKPPEILTSVWNNSFNLDAVGFTLATSFVLISVALCVTVAASLLWLVGSIIYRLNSVTSRRRRINSVTHHSLPREIIRSIHALKALRTTHPTRRQEALKGASMCLRAVTQDLARLASTCGSTSLWSHRRRLLREHHGVIVSALRAAESNLDKDSDTGSKKLAEILMEIGNRYAQGKVGELLPESETANLQPARNWEVAKMAAIAVNLCAVTFIALLLKVPDAALTPVIGASGILTAILLYGRRARSAFEILDSVRGIQRP